jgi:hypothetical protein
LVGPDEQVNAQIAVCEEGHVPLPVGVVEGQAAIPSAGSDAAESSVGGEAEELVSELGPTGFEVADESQEKGVLGSQVQDPLVVFFPGAGFDDDCSGDSERFSEGSEVAGQHSAVED